MHQHFRDFAKLCGEEGPAVTDAKDLDAAYKKGLSSKKPFIIEIMTDAMLT